VLIGRKLAGGENYAKMPSTGVESERAEKKVGKKVGTQERIWQKTYKRDSKV
jgi:hypothetical protein